MRDGSQDLLIDLPHFVGDEVAVDFGGALAGAGGKAIVFILVVGETGEGRGETGGAASGGGDGDEDAAVVGDDIDEAAAGVGDDGEAEGDGFVEDATGAVDQT